MGYLQAAGLPLEHRKGLSRRTAPLQYQIESADSDVRQLGGKGDANARANGEADEHVEAQEDNPGDLQHDGDGEQAGGQGADFGVLVVLGLSPSR